MGISIIPTAHFVSLLLIQNSTASPKSCYPYIAFFVHGDKPWNGGVQPNRAALTTARSWPTIESSTIPFARGGHRLIHRSGNMHRAGPISKPIVGE